MHRTYFIGYLIYFFCSTILKQEASINVRGVPLSGYLEGVVEGTIDSNAGKVCILKSTIVSCKARLCLKDNMCKNACPTRNIRKINQIITQNIFVFM